MAVAIQNAKKVFKNEKQVEQHFLQITERLMIMRNFIAYAFCIALPAVSAEVSTSIPISEGKNEFRVNTADYYSWNTRTEIVAFKHVKASEFSQLLKNCVSAYGKIQINDKLNMIIITEEPNKLKDILMLCGKLDTPEMDGFKKIESEIISINYSKASAILPFISDFLTIEGNAKSNDELNYIAITDHPDIIKRIKAEVSKFDIPPKQIEFKFHIVEVYKQNNSDIGTSWGELFNIVNANASYNYSANTQTNTSTPGSSYDNSSKSTGYGVNIGVNPRAISDFIHLMVEKKAINLVADNSLLCINNVSSTFTFHYYNKTMTVKMKPVAINDKTLLLQTTILSNGEVLLQNSTLTDIGSSNLLLRLTINDSQINNKKVPILGTVLPYLFSKDVKNQNVSSIDIVCTPIMQVTKR